MLFDTNIIAPITLFDQCVQAARLNLEDLARLAGAGKTSASAAAVAAASVDVLYRRPAPRSIQASSSTLSLAQLSKAAASSKLAPTTTVIATAIAVPGSETTSSYALGPIAAAANTRPGASAAFVRVWPAGISTVLQPGATALYGSVARAQQQQAAAATRGLLQRQTPSDDLLAMTLSGAFIACDGRLGLLWGVQPLKFHQKKNACQIGHIQKN